MILDIKKWNNLENDRLELSNNRAERSIKPFVIGRKNWLFCNTHASAKFSAVIYSIVETAKENGLAPYAYLTYVFEQIQFSGTENLDDLLPMSDRLQPTCRIPTKAEVAHENTEH